jgi:hypothetical protein
VLTTLRLVDFERAVLEELAAGISAVVAAAALTAVLIPNKHKVAKASVASRRYEFSTNLLRQQVDFGPRLITAGADKPVKVR